MFLPLQRLSLTLCVQSVLSAVRASMPMSPADWDKIPSVTLAMCAWAQVLRHKLARILQILYVLLATLPHNTLVLSLYSAHWMEACPHVLHAMVLVLWVT